MKYLYYSSCSYLFQFTVFARKQPLDRSSDKENEDFFAMLNKNSRRKAKAIILETDSDEEEIDSPSIRASCDSSRRKQIHSTEMKGEVGKAVDYLIFIPICT